jgi:hypothetical protein
MRPVRMTCQLGPETETVLNYFFWTVVLVKFWHVVSGLYM